MLLQAPFEGYKLGQITSCIVNNLERPAVPSCCPDDYRSLMEACWANDATARPAFSDVRCSLQKLGKVYKFQKGAQPRPSPVALPAVQ